MDSCHGNPSPSDPMESVCRHFPPPPHLYLAVYLLSLLRTVSRRSDGLLPRQPVSIGSDGVRLPTFSTPSGLPVSLVAHGLLPSDSVWVYWTTLAVRELLKLSGVKILSREQRKNTTDWVNENLGSLKKDYDEGLRK